MMLLSASPQVFLFCTAFWRFSQSCRYFSSFGSRLSKQKLYFHFRSIVSHALHAPEIFFRHIDSRNRYDSISDFCRRNFDIHMPVLLLVRFPDYVVFKVQRNCLLLIPDKPRCAETVNRTMEYVSGTDIYAVKAC